MNCLHYDNLFIEFELDWAWYKLHKTTNKYLWKFLSIPKVTKYSSSLIDGVTSPCIYWCKKIFYSFKVVNKIKYSKYTGLWGCKSIWETFTLRRIYLYSFCLFNVFLDTSDLLQKVNKNEVAKSCMFSYEFELFNWIIFQVYLRKI